jgi:hypothetical protein
MGKIIRGDDGYISNQRLNLTGCWMGCGVGIPRSFHSGCTVEMIYFGMFLGLFFSVLSADLLYLYYNGCWYDPYKFIENTEVVMLYVFVLTGIFYTTLYTIKLWRSK